MASGSRRKRGQDEYVFIDGQAMRADEVVRIDLTSSDVSVPGQAEAASVPGAAEVAARPKASRFAKKEKKPREENVSAARAALREMEQDDAFALREDAVEGALSMVHTERLMAEDSQAMRRKYLIFGIALIVVFLFGLCVSGSYSWRIYSPMDVIDSLAKWFTMTFTGIFDSANYQAVRNEFMSNNPAMMDIASHVQTVIKYTLSGALLAVAGMLYQNTFRNPIAAPSMLGVSSGISLVLLIMVVIFGTEAANYVGIYYAAAYAGGAIVLILVLLGGKWISGKGRFNVVNMILMGTIVSQLVGVITTYVQNVTLTDDTWLIYQQLQNATSATGTPMWISLFVGFVVAMIPIVLFRFKLNLVSFSDAETRLLGVDPNKLRILALVCGSVMVLTAQVNTGQVAMASLVVPFVVRAVFGAEFRKQLWGNILVGALLLLVCGLVSDFVLLWGTTVDVGSIVSIIALPLFVWMLAVRQRSWE